MTIMESSTTAIQDFFQTKFSPEIQGYIKKAIGVGLTIYVGHAVLSSMYDEFRSPPKLNQHYDPAATDGLSTDDALLTVGKIKQRNAWILALPHKLRQQIWRKLSVADQKAVRLTCKRFLWDVDFGVGIGHVVINTSEKEECFKWVKTVGVRSCTIDYIQQAELELGMLSFLKKPFLLEHLVVNYPLSIDMLETFFMNCLNISTISFHLDDDGRSVSSYLKCEQIFAIIALRVEFELNLLVVQIPHGSNTCLWTMHFSKTVNKKSLANESKHEANSGYNSTIPHKIKYLFLDMDLHQDCDETCYYINYSFWRKVIQNQIQLKVLKCNFGADTWEWGTMTFNKNCKTLELLELVNVNWWNSCGNCGGAEIPFNWNIFATSQKLLNLKICAGVGPVFGPKLYLPLMPTQMFLQKLNCNFGITFWEFFSSIIFVNSKTLKEICLLRLSTYDISKDHHVKFDWKIFEKCEKLQSLVLAGERLTFLANCNIDCIPTNNLEHFQISWFDLELEDVHFMVNEMQLKNGYEFFEWCSIDGVFPHERKVAHLVETCRRKNNRNGAKEVIMKCGLFLLGMPTIAFVGSIWLLWTK